MSAESTELRDELGEALGYRQGPTTVWWGPCHVCGEPEASVATTGFSCPQCQLVLTLDALAAKCGAWPPEPDQPGAATPEPLPVDVLPPALRNHVRSVADSAQVSSDMPAAFALCCVSAACAGKVQVRVDDAWTREWITLYVAVVAEPGERKSAAFRAMDYPLSEWEIEAAERVAPLHRAAEDVADVAERRLKHAKEACAKGKGLSKGGQPVRQDEIEHLANELDKARRAIPAIPRLLASDSTPEALVRQMAEQGGRVAVLSPEGGPLQMLDGRYSKDGAARLEELAQAYDGEALRSQRIGRETYSVRRPALTLGVALQPSVLDTIKNARSLRGQGIYGRIAWVVPASRVGSRVDSSAAPPLDEAAAARYARVIRALLQWQPETEDDGATVPVVMRLSGEAAEVKAAYHNRVESALGAGGDYVAIRDAATKTVGRAIRIAALLELAARAEDGRPLTGEPISGWAMASAVRICEALVTHTLHVYGRMDMDARTADLRYLLDRLRELRRGTTESDLRAAVRGRKTIEGAGDLASLLDELEERGCIRRRTVQRSGRGRPPSPNIVLHPSFSVLPVHERGEKHSASVTPAESFPVFPVSERGGGGQKDDEEARPTKALEPQGKEEEENAESYGTTAENTVNPDDDYTDAAERAAIQAEGDYDEGAETPAETIPTEWPFPVQRSGADQLGAVR